jgi:lipoprotein-anchoring transpeptidase ErfK/SrfK
VKPAARRRPRRFALAIGAAAASLAAAGSAVLWVESTSSAEGNDELALPASPKPALIVPRPTRLPKHSATSYWVTVRRDVSARAAPSSTAPIVARLARRTSDETTNAVLVLSRARDAAGRLWVQARLPILPNGSTGWLPRSALGVYGVVHTRLVVDLEGLTATLLRDNRPVFRAPIGIGEAEWPTPTGEFYIRSKLTRYSSPFYGPLAFGTSARSAVLTDWPGGGFVGIHGTNAPELLPGRVSHGCIRLRNEDILELGRLLPVGTPLTIH